MQQLWREAWKLPTKRNEAEEGTILTVAKEAAAKAVELAETAEDLDTFFQAVIAHAEETLARTPEMLPVLKEAGVVDSGGQGLVEVSTELMMVIWAKKDRIIHSSAVPKVHAVTKIECTDREGY